LTHGSRAASVQVDCVFAGNSVGDLLAHGNDTTLLVSELANLHLLRLASLVDAPGICVLGPTAPEESVVRAANDSGRVLLLASGDLDETYRRLRARGVECKSRGPSP
jgi:hypothetical protein